MFYSFDLFLYIYHDYLRNILFDITNISQYHINKLLACKKDFTMLEYKFHFVTNKNVCILHIFLFNLVERNRGLVQLELYISRYLLQNHLHIYCIGL